MKRQIRVILLIVSNDLRRNNMPKHVQRISFKWQKNRHRKISSVYLPKRVQQMSIFFSLSFKRRNHDHRHIAEFILRVVVF